MPNATWHLAFGIDTMLLAFVSLLVFQSADLFGVKHTDPVPSEIAASVAASLAPGGVRATVGTATLSFWWVKTLPMKVGGSWGDVPEGALVGAVRIDKDFRDIRGRVIKPGTYTLRYGIQPANGDHLGVSPFREFLLLSPAGVDTDAAPKGHDGAIDLSKQVDRILRSGASILPPQPNLRSRSTRPIWGTRPSSWNYPPRAAHTASASS